MTSNPEAGRLVDAAQKLYDRKNYAAAAEQYQLASNSFNEAGDSASGAEMANNQSVALALARNFESAWEAARGTEKIFLDMGDNRRAGLACGNQAAALEGMGKIDEALELYERSASLLKAAGDAASRTAVLKSITSLQARRGDSLQALASAEAALNTGAPLSVREKILKKLIDVPFRMLGRR